MVVMVAVWATAGAWTDPITDTIAGTTAAPATTTLQPTTTTALAPTYGNIATLRQFLINDGYGYLVDGADDDTIGRLGQASCNVASNLDSWQEMTLITLLASSQTGYSQDESIELAAVSLGEYCPWVTDGWTD